jgi:tetratricopeptide (TPR) repeat protein
MARAPAAITAVIQKLSPQPEVVPRAGDPKSAVLELQIARLDQVRKTEVFWDARAERDLRRSVAQAIPAVLRSITTTRWLGDLIAALVEVSIEDGGSGVWRAKLDAAGASERIYLALDRGAVKVLGTAADPSGVGRYLLGRDPRTDAASRRLLDWLVADVDKTSARGAALQRVWSPGAPASHDAIRLAAAVVAGPTDPDRVIAIASRCPSTLPDAELACHETLFAAYRARGKSAEAARESDAILAARPGDLRARAREHAQALARAGRFDDAEHVLDEILAKQPTHALARLARLEVAAIRGDVADVVNRARAIGAFPAVTAPELNDVAWYEACAGADLTGALELARKAAERLPKSGGIANTLAVLEAQVGDLGHAIRDNRNAMELRNIVEPEPGDWLAVGLIREQLGQLADAADAYRRVTREPGVDAVFDAYTLAQRRLAARKSWK